MKKKLSCDKTVMSILYKVSFSLLLSSSNIFWVVVVLQYFVLQLKNALERSKLRFYVPFNTQDNTGTGPQHFHLWEVQPTYK